MSKLKWSKIFCSVSILLCMVFILQSFAFAQFETAAGSAILVEASTGQVLYEKNADNPVAPASITKLMTLLLGFEAVEKGKATWDDMVPISEKAWKMEGSKMFLEVGKKIKYSDLITGISVVSANDGCVALAEYLYGSESAFVEAMNQRARELNLTKTQYKNSSGLDVNGHQMSARDIATLARYLMEKYPKILEIESKTEFTYNDIRQPNRNPLLGAFPGADGLKTGWTDAAGYCLVGTAKQNGRRLISVILNTKNEAERLAASQELLNHGFKNFEPVNIKNANDIVDSIDVKDGKKPAASVKVNSDISLVLPSTRKDDVKIVIEKSSTSLNAPVTADTVVGQLKVQLDDQTLATADIATAESVQKAGFFKRLFDRIGKFLNSLFKK